MTTTAIILCGLVDILGGRALFTLAVVVVVVVAACFAIHFQTRNHQVAEHLSESEATKTGKVGLADVVLSCQNQWIASR